MPNPLHSLRRLRHLPRDLFGAVNALGERIDALAEARAELPMQTGPDPQIEALAALQQEVAVLADDMGRGLLALERRAIAGAEQAGRIDRATRHAQHATGAMAERLDLLGPLQDQIGQITAALARLPVLESGLATLLDRATTLANSDPRAELLALSDRIAALERGAARQSILYPASLWSVAAADPPRAILALLRPQAAAGMAKCRVGRDRDGGYVMLDAFGSIGGACSLGIADDASWDAGMAARGIAVLQLDPSIAHPPESPPGTSFLRLRAAAHPCADGLTLAQMLGRLDQQPGGRLLKMDIEGDEWDVLDAAEDAVLDRFDQIVCEFHTLERLADAGFAARAHRVFARLARTHFVAHVHGNNCGNFVNVANMMLPQSLELSFAARRCFTPVETDETFPTPLDRPNEPGRADLALGSFRFSPPD